MIGMALVALCVCMHVCSYICLAHTSDRLTIRPFRSQGSNVYQEPKWLSTKMATVTYGSNIHHGQLQIICLVQST